MKNDFQTFILHTNSEKLESLRYVHRIRNYFKSSIFNQKLIIPGTYLERNSMTISIFTIVIVILQVIQEVLRVTSTDQVVSHQKRQSYSFQTVILNHKSQSQDRLQRKNMKNIMDFILQLIMKHLVIYHVVQCLTFQWHQISQMQASFLMLHSLNHVRNSHQTMIRIAIHLWILIFLYPIEELRLLKTRKLLSNQKTRCHLSKTKLLHCENANHSFQSIRLISKIFLVLLHIKVYHLWMKIKTIHHQNRENFRSISLRKMERLIWTGQTLLLEEIFRNLARKVIYFRLNFFIAKTAFIFSGP